MRRSAPLASTDPSSSREEPRIAGDSLFVAGSKLRPVHTVRLLEGKAHRQMDGRMDRWMNGQTDGQTDNSNKETRKWV